MDHLVGVRISEKQLASLGDLVVEFTHLEFRLEFVLCGILRISMQQLKILLDKAMIQAKITLVEELGSLRLRSGKSKRELAEMMSELRHLNQLRAIAVHGLYQVPLSEHLKAYLRDTELTPDAYKHSKRGQPSKLGVDKFTRIANDTATKGDQLMAFAAKHWIRKRK